VFVYEDLFRCGIWISKRDAILVNKMYRYLVRRDRGEVSEL
jgi:hypothetical protein